ncbi:2-amino-4-hydroxy-6-hydroxymethyldihydropteridine pyrophosphokinase [Candidatus Photodesmus blepharus]|uniref:2-amino-4-hydroxy-6-hydroxymethyldihydropteridine pyrophosphokinase n=1 Tax=Candidatus Photodesmus blepharonis TaxID=1179155 RepID=A0A084CN48_9GAMM|nr:2-amino-4-hydroxy-6-hydroxymethyldihydropteridine diphosphokinase [Candidatus Photodesmus blepharus]KEY91227.1 2-amino-4-hydroxy-6-hydroxymethyldihydropteridine pyrophosphokinase [Candidatus Photodesmus blepharus]
MVIVYIGLGSNLFEPKKQVTRAVEELKNLPRSKFVKASSLYSSKPMGPKDQPNYINAIVAIETRLMPIELLNYTQEIEKKRGRLRKNEHWGPRILDLDVILFGNETINSERLTVPHYGIKDRKFVLYPLLEIVPDLQLPDGTKLRTLLKSS